MRKTNRELFNSLVRAKGEKAIERVAVESNVSYSLVAGLLYGNYRGGRVPARATRERLCTYFGVSEDLLFPEETTKGRAAS